MQEYHSDRLSDFLSFAELEQFIEERDAKPLSKQGSFEEYEHALCERFRALECDVKARHLARYDVDAQLIEVGGREWRKCLDKEPKTYRSSSGPVTVARNLFRPSGGGKSICPLDFRAGIVGGLMTPNLGRQVLFLMGHLTSADTASVFEQMGVAGLSSSTCDRLPKVFDSVWESRRDEWDSALRSQEEVPVAAHVIAVSLDGVMVPDKQGQREAKKQREEAQKKGRAKQQSGPAGYREVGCGTVSLFDSEGKRLDTIRYGRAPEYKKATLTKQLDAEVLSIMSVRPDLVLVALADGAEENWRYFDRPGWEDAVKIVDFGHGSQHLSKACHAFFGQRSVRGRSHYERLKVVLKDGESGVGDVIEQLKQWERKAAKSSIGKERRKTLTKERKYFENQHHRMDYARYQELGLPIGSGVVEAACKTLATQRMKRSGMSWGGGKQAVLTIRSLQQSNRWNRGWALFSGEGKKDIAVVQKHGELKSYTPVDAAA